MFYNASPSKQLLFAFDKQLLFALEIQDGSVSRNHTFRHGMKKAFPGAELLPRGRLCKLRFGSNIRTAAYGRPNVFVFFG